MITINRTAIVVRPGQPFLDWLHRADPTSSELNLEDLRREPTVYLLPECENVGSPLGNRQNRHVRTLDAATGRVTPTRILGAASDGKFYAPFDAFVRLGIQSARFFHTRGEFTVEVPPGRMTVEIAKGFESHPAKAEVDIPMDRVANVEVRLKRLADTAAEGWYGGSTHVHMNYGGNLRNTPENTIFMGEA